MTRGMLCSGFQGMRLYSAGRIPIVLDPSGLPAYDDT